MHVHCIWYNKLRTLHVFVITLLFHHIFPMIVLNNLNMVVLGYYKRRVKLMFELSVSFYWVSLLCDTFVLKRGQCEFVTFV